MPAKGTRKIRKQEKAEIIAEQCLETARSVARKHGIATNTVYTIKQKATDEILALAEDYRQKIVKQARLNVIVGLEAMYERIEDSSTPLRELTPAVRTSHEIVQLQTGGPTGIIREQADLLKEFTEYCLSLAEGDKRMAAAMLVHANSKISRELRERAAERMLME